AIAQRWNGRIMNTVDRPAHDRWRSFAARAALALSSPRSDIAGNPAGAPVAEKLPPVITGNAWIVAESDEAGTVELNDVQPPIFFIRIKPTAKIQRQAVAAIVTGTRNADPIRAARGLRRVLARLIKRALVANELGLVGHTLRTPG